MVQVGLLVRVVPQRWRNGLMHLLVPATIGTLVGAAPVVVVVLLLLDGATTTAANATAAACGAGCGGGAEEKFERRVRENYGSHVAAIGD